MYGLKMDYFAINPKRESNIFFVREKQFDNFLSDIKATLKTGRTPRYVVFGFFGVGKTQFLLHLKTRLAEAECIYIETPSFHRRSRFVEFYRTVVMNLGKSRVMKTLERGIELIQKNQLQPYEIGLTQDLLDVISTGLEKDTFTLWRWLTGQKLSTADAKLIESVNQELGDENAVVVLNSLSILNKEFRNKPLLFLIDEFENTMHLSGDARVSFSEAMRSLVDEGSEAGVIFALTARGLGEMPSSVSDEPIKRRIGITNYVAFSEYDETELEEFILQVIGYRRKETFNAKEALDHVPEGETVTEKTYPFSRQAIEEIVRSVVLFKEQGKIDAIRPKEALDLMDKALRKAIQNQLLIITKSDVLDVREKVVEALRL